MRRLLPVLLAVIALAPMAAAQAGDVKLVLEPAVARAEPGGQVVVSLAIANPTNRSIGFELAPKSNATGVVAKLQTTVVKVPAGERVKVPMTIEVAPDAAPGVVGVGVVATQVEPLAAARAPTHSARMELQVVAVADAPPPAPPPPAPDRTLAVAASAGAAGVGLVALAWAHRRWGLLGLAPLYTRLAKSRMLESPLRQRFVEIVGAEPGISFGELQRRLDVGAGTLTHHARMLEQAGIVFSSPDGEKRRFFLAQHGRVEPVPSLADRALAELSRLGPTSASRLAQRLGVSRQALHYHVKRLVTEGKLAAREDGRDLVLSVP